MPQEQEQRADLQPVAAVRRVVPAVKAVGRVVPAAEAAEQAPISRR